MKKLMSEIKDDAKNKKIKNIYIANLLNVNRSQITHYYNGTNQMSFLNFLELLDIVYSNEQEKREKILRFCKCDSRPESIRECFEWCSHNGNEELMDFLFEIHEKSEKIEKKLIDMYSLLRKRNKKLVTSEEYYDQVDEIKLRGTNHIETSILIKIITLYAYFDFNSYDLVLNVSKSIHEQIRQLSNGYLKEAFRLRLAEIIIISKMRKNELTFVESFINNELNEINYEKFPIVYITMLCVMSEIKAFSDYQCSMKYINLAMEALKKLKLSAIYLRKKSIIESTSDFINITNNKFDGLYLTDKSERAHYYAKLDEDSKKKSVILLNEIEAERGFLSTFQMYYKSLALNDKDLFNSAIVQFIKNGNLFYANNLSDHLIEF